MQNYKPFNISMIGTKYNCRGSNKNKHLKYYRWIRIEFNDEIKKLLTNEYSQYSAIHLTPYYFCNEIVDQINKGTNTDLPNIDIGTMNIHPKWTEQDLKKYEEDSFYKQAILVRKNKTKWGSRKPDQKRVCFKKFKENHEEYVDYNMYFPYPSVKEENNFSADELIIGLLRQVMDEDKLKESNTELYQIIFGENIVKK